MGRAQRNNFERWLLKPINKGEGVDEEKPADEKNLGENNVLTDEFIRGTHYRVTTDRTPLPISLTTPTFTDRSYNHLTVADVMYELRTGPHITKAAILRLDHAFCQQIIGQQRLGTPIPPAPPPVATRTMDLLLWMEPKTTRRPLPTGRNKRRFA